MCLVNELTYLEQMKLDYGEDSKKDLQYLWLFYKYLIWGLGWEKHDS